MTATFETNDLLVFSHLPWGDHFDRIHSQLSRKAKHRRVFYFEVPNFTKTALPHLQLKETFENVLLVTPCLPEKLNTNQVRNALRDLVNELIYDEDIHDFTACYFTPEAITFTRHLKPRSVIYDVVHSQVHQAEAEEELIRKADLVITTEPDFYERRKSLHHNIHLFSEELDPQVFEGLCHLELMIGRPFPHRHNSKIIPVFN